MFMIGKTFFMHAKLPRQKSPTENFRCHLPLISAHDFTSVLFWQIDGRNAARISVLAALGMLSFPYQLA